MDFNGRGNYFLRYVLQGEFILSTQRFNFCSVTSVVRLISFHLRISELQEIYYAETKSQTIFRGNTTHKKTAAGFAGGSLGRTYYVFGPNCRSFNLPQIRNLREVAFLCCQGSCPDRAPIYDLRATNHGSGLPHFPFSDFRFSPFASRLSSLSH